jgi:hypothetical protein
LLRVVRLHHAFSQNLLTPVTQLAREKMKKEKNERRVK